jgi:hypothetical protein
MAYVVPTTALKVTKLVKVPPSGESSFWAMAVRPETEVPVKTPSIVSKVLPIVEMVTVPDEGAVQDHQTDAPPALPAIGGSPGSLVAPTLESVTVLLDPEMTVALLNMSFCGPVNPGFAACVIVKVWPARLSVPVREMVLVLAVTDHVTVPGPVPVPGAQVSHEGTLLLAVQLQVELDGEIVTVPLAEP